MLEPKWPRTMNMYTCSWWRGHGIKHSKPNLYMYSCQQTWFTKIVIANNATLRCTSVGDHNLWKHVGRPKPTQEHRNRWNTNTGKTHLKCSCWDRLGLYIVRPVIEAKAAVGSRAPLLEDGPNKSRYFSNDVQAKTQKWREGPTHV